MTWLSGIFSYILIWWVVLFAVLPWWVKVPDRPEAGHATSAPVNPRLWLKALITTGVAFVLWLGLFFLMRSGVISLRDPAPG